MPPRLQKTPHGDVTLTSRWKHARYYLVAAGSLSALRWMFPNHTESFEFVTISQSRHMFQPANIPITVERILRQACAGLQEIWDNCLAEFTDQKTVGGPPVEQQPRTLGQIIDRYQTFRADELALATRERNRHYLTRWQNVLGSGALLTELTEELLINGRTALAKDLKPSSLNCMLATLKSVLRWAEARSIPVLPAYRTVRGVREVANAREKAWWTTDEVDIALAAAAQVDQDLIRKQDDVPAGTATLLIAFGCLLGLRYEEIIMLRWQDLELDGLNQRTKTPAPVAHIVPQEGWIPKDGEGRTVPMHERLVEIVRPYRQDLGWVLNPAKVMPKRGGTKRVYRYDPKKIWLRVLKKATAAGAKIITPNGMRHSFASNLLMAGVSDVLVARWMGHADTSMIHSHYGHLLSYHSDINRVQIAPVGPVQGCG